MLTKVIYPLSLREKISWRIQKFFPEINGKDIRLEFSKDIRMDLSKNDIGHKSIILNGFYELDLTRTIVKLARQGRVLFDVGANYGYFSCLWTAQNALNKAYAFEASPNNIQPLKNNVSKNKLTDKIIVVPTAMGKEQGKLKFDLAIDRQQTGWGGFVLNNSLSSVDVQVDTIDNFANVNKIKMIDVLKIDVEGADTWVLYGATELLKEKRIRHIFFEHNSPRMKLLNIGEDDARHFLRKHGYLLQRKTASDFYAYPENDLVNR